MDEIKDEYWLGYLAGMIDGEGTIGLNKYYHGRHKALYFKKLVVIASSSSRPLEKLQSIFGGKIYKFSARKSCHKDAYILKWTTTDDIERLLKLPFKLFIKEPQRQLMLKALKYFESLKRGRGWGQRGRPYWMTKRLEEMVKEMKELNKRGKN